MRTAQPIAAFQCVVIMAYGFCAFLLFSLKVNVCNMAEATLDMKPASIADSTDVVSPMR